MKKLIAGLVMTAALPVMAQDNAAANNFNYSFVEADYVDFDSGFDGFRVKGSFDLQSNLAVIGSVGLYDEKNADLRVVSGGVAYHRNAGELLEADALRNTDLVFHGELEWAEVSVDCPSFASCRDDDDIGILAGVEARIAIIDRLEAFADLSLRTTWDTDVVFGGGVRFSVIEQLQLLAGVELADDDNIYLGARFNF